MSAQLRPWAYWLRPPSVDLRDTAKALTIVINKSTRPDANGSAIRDILRMFDATNVMGLRDEDVADYVAELKKQFPNWQSLTLNFLKR